MANGWNTYNDLNGDTLCLHRVDAPFVNESVEVDVSTEGELRLEVDCGGSERAVAYLDFEAAQKLLAFLNEKMGG